MDRNTKGQFIKGMTPWNKSQLIEKICEFCGKKFKVKPYRKETARFCSYYCMGKITGFKKGKPALNPFPKGHKINLGRKLTKEHRRKLSEVHKEKIPWNKGKKLSQKIRKNMSKAVRNRYKNGEIFGFQKGKSHIFWKGGISSEPYPFEWDNIKKKIRRRDNNICQICGKRGQPVHHIDYNKKNCDFQNLITLCFRCNSKVNFNRKYWINYFQNKLCVN